MNKLISRNPVLRFKLGRKITKFYRGGIPNDEYVGGGTKIVNWLGNLFKGWSPYTGVLGNKKSTNSTSKTTTKSQTTTTPKTLLNKTTTSTGTTPPYELSSDAQKVVNERNKKIAEVENLKRNSQSVVKKQPVNKTEYDDFLYAGKMGGWNKSIGLGNIKDLESLDIIKQLGWEGKSAEEVLKLLNSNDIGGNRVVVDNKWGNQSKAALQNYYSRWKNEQEMLHPTVKKENSSTIQLPQAPIMLRQAISDYSNYASNLKSALGNNNNFQGLSNLVWKEYADDDNSFAANFSRDMRTRFKDYGTLLSWLDNQAAIEKLLNISGRYRGSRSGDFGDIARSQASWAGEYNQGIDKLNLTALNNYNAIIDKYKRTVGGYKIGGQLPSRNIVERFKKFREGGLIPKLQTAWLPINWNDNNEFVDLVVSNVANEVKKALNRVENYRKANKVANRKTKVPGIDNTAKLQLVLYDKGFFKGVIDKRKTGKQVTLERAVDGYMGDMTNQAIQNAKKAGYTVDVNTGEIKLPKKKEFAYGKTQKPQIKKLQASTFSFNNVKNTGKELLGRIFGDKDIITGRNELDERSYQSRYNTPYSLEIDRGEPAMKRLVGPDGFISYQLVEGSDGRPVYTSKAGNLGLFNRKTDEEGRVCYQIKNDKGELVTRCSETGNLINRSLGLPTTGDAWTRHGVYGDSLIYGGADHNKIYSRPVGKIINGLRPDLLNPNNLKTGDFVDLYTEGSGHNAEAAKGRGNSHTGTIYKPMGDNGPVYIIHGGFNDKVYIDPLDRFGPLSTWSIMGVRRPGSKEHPYYKEDI